MEKQIKSYNEVDFSVDEGKREIVVTICTDAVDRDNEIVLPKGMRKGKNYAGNPLVMVNHDLKEFPIGKTLWLKVEENKIIAKAYISDKTQKSRDIFGLIQDKVIGAASVGFLAYDRSAPTEKELRNNPKYAGARTVIRDWELLEWSIVTVPCNPEALIMAVSKGYSPEILNFIGATATEEKPEDIEIQVLKDLARQAEELNRKTKEIPEPKFCKAIPLPTYSRSLKQIRAEIASAAKQILSPEDILDRYRGRI